VTAVGGADRDLGRDRVADPGVKDSQINLPALGISPKKAHSTKP
jgi:hypothetical protein